MDRKEKVLGYIKSKEYIPLKFEELAVMLGVPEEDRNELSAILKELEKEGKIEKSKKARYLAVENETTFVGKLLCNRNGKFGFIVCDDDHDDIFVETQNMNDALHGDKVLVKVIGKSDQHEDGRIIRVCERNLKSFVGIVKRGAHDCYYVYPDDKRIFARVRVNRPDMADAVKGERVLAEITRYDLHGRCSGKIIKSLGDAENLKSCMEAIIIENSVKCEFADDVIKQLEDIPDKVLDISDRLDLRNETIFTIDGETARDFDDAVNISKCDNGNYKLGVHIADVTHYVTQGSALDEEAFERGTSVYLPDRVIPMLPEKLSNGICSLNPNVDRLTLSVFMEIDKNGDVVEHSLHKSVICSCARLTYEKVNRCLENVQDVPGYEKYIDIFHEMENLAGILKRRRIKRGAIEFDFPESSIITDENGDPVQILRAERGISNKIIEEFMLVANETVAEYAFWSELPFVYRIHEAPSEEKIVAFQLFLKPFGMSIKGKIDKDNPVKPKALEQILKSVKDTPEERVIAKTMLRSLMKAEYSSENEGHFGLAAKYYCHFTSPIRRYPDLCIHRILKMFIDGKLNSEMMAFFDGFVKSASKNSSEREQAAELCERDADDLMKAAYMENYIGEEFCAVISGITKFGIFAELENSIEGLIRLENMVDDYYIYNDDTVTLTGERTGRVYKIGDEINVVVAKSDILSRQIEFVLNKEEFLHTRIRQAMKKPHKRLKRRR